MEPPQAKTSLVVNVLTLFPETVQSALSEGMVRIAKEQGALDLRTIQIRDYAKNVHRTTDDTPYGGGGGMVMKPEPIVDAWRDLPEPQAGPTYVLSPRGPRFDRSTAWAWSEEKQITLVCGRYQGVDERALETLGAKEISLGDFVLAGGELAAAVMIEAVARLLPGVLGDENSRAQDSFEDDLLGFPVYTRPEEFEGRKVPEVLLSGHHEKIQKWRRQRRLETTWYRRPELLGHAALSDEDREFLRTLSESQRPVNETTGDDQEGES